MLEHLSAHLREWQLADPQLLTVTTTSQIYTVRSGDETVILKWLTPIGQSDEAPGAMALRAFNGQGAVRLLKHDAQAHLLEYADGPDLTPLVDQGQDAGATTIIAAVLNKLHSVSIDDPSQRTGLVPLRRWFQSLFTKAAADRENSVDSIYTRAAIVTESLLSTARDECVLHGDIHHQNIRYHARRGWLAFDPKGLYGERTYDVANTLCNPVDRPDLVLNEARLLKNAAILAGQLHIELNRILAFTFAYGVLSAVWSAEYGGESYHALQVAEMAETNMRASN